MSVLPSLIAALERAAGDCLVLRSGERPHVVAGESRHDVGNTVLSAKAVEALAAQILSSEGHKELSERSSVQEVLGVDLDEGSLTARAERAGDEIYVELRRHRRPPKPARIETPQMEPVHAAAEPHDAGLPAPRRSEQPPAAGVPIDPLPVAEVDPEPRVEQFSHGEQLSHAGPDAPPAHHPEAAAPAAFVVERFDEVSVTTIPVSAQERTEHAPPAPAEPAPREAVESAPAAAAEPMPIASELPPVVSASVVPALEPVAASPAPEPPAPPAPVVPEAEEPVAMRETVPPRAVEQVGTPAAMHVPMPAPLPAGVRRSAAIVPPPAPSRDLTDDLDELIADAAERGATAIYLREGQAPAARIDERLQPLDDAVVSAARMKDIIASCTSGGDGWTAGDHGAWMREFDLAGMVTCYPFADHAGSGVVIRLASRSAAAGVQRHVPRQIRRACESEDGLLLVAAATQGDLLALVGAVGDLAARKRAGYVICLEPAGGLPHPVAGAFVSERKLTGTRDEMRATIRRAVQEGPDILVVAATEPPVGLEEVILSAAMPGRLVVLGVVAPTAVRAFESILASMDRDREPHVRKVFAAALRAAFGYRGLRRIGGGRTAVQDVVVGTGDVRTRLERADFGAIEQLQRQGRDGMRTLDAALAKAVARRQVTLRHAAAYAMNRSELVAFTRRDARERRALEREPRQGEWRQGALRAI